MFAILVLAVLASASADCAKSNQIGSCGEHVHCCHDSGVIEVSHVFTAIAQGFTEHRCFVTSDDECQCECPMLVNCAGDWAQSSTTCPAACGGNTCEATETFTRTADGIYGGDDSCPANGATRAVAGSQETSNACPAYCAGDWAETSTTCPAACGGNTCAATETYTRTADGNIYGDDSCPANGATREVAGLPNNSDCIPNCVVEEVAHITSWNGGSNKCNDDGNKVESKTQTNRNCVFKSDKVLINHPHGYLALKASFRYREKGSLENGDYARAQFRACTTQDSNASCGDWSDFVEKVNDISTNNNNWSDWVTYTGDDHAISLDDKYIQVKLTLKGDAVNEYQKAKGARLTSSCDAQ